VIYPVRIYTPEGELMAIVTPTEKQEKLRKDFKFGKVTETEKYLILERITDEFINDYWEFE
jgi:hypothetical protein